MGAQAHVYGVPKEAGWHGAQAEQRPDLNGIDRAERPFDEQRQVGRVNNVAKACKAIERNKAASPERCKRFAFR